MRKLFSSRKRFIGLGLMSALVIALAVLGTLWGFSQRASAAPDGPVSLVHVNTDGSDYAGNPACPGTVWDKGKVTIPLDDTDYCNNVTSRNHVIRTEGFDEVEGLGGYALPFTCPDENFACAQLEGVGNVGVDYCGDLPDLGPNWSDDNDGELCIVIHSKDPGESTITFSYYDAVAGHDYVTTPVVKEWRKLHDTVILKTGDLKEVTLPGGAKVYLPKDDDGDGDRDTDDEHAMDHDGEVQNHSVVMDEVSKGISSLSGPIWLVDVVHGVEKPVDPVFHDPVEGAVILAFIDSPRGCTFFTNPAITIDSLTLFAAGTLNYGTAVVGISNAQGQFVGPQRWPVGAQFSDEALAEAAAHLLSEGWSHTGTSWVWEPHLGVYVDTTCEEQATITFKVGYPGHVGSAPQYPEPESHTINWTTLELFKQPQIRWAGEEIILATRWALPDEWYPNAKQGVCPLATIPTPENYTGWYGDFEFPYIGPMAPAIAISHNVNYVKKDPSPGALEGAYIDEDGDGSLDTLAFMGASEARGDIDDLCVSKALYDSEVAGQVDVEAKLVEATWACDAEYILGEDADDDGDGCIDEDPWDGLDNDTGVCATDPEVDECDDDVDDDDDGKVNDGCPKEGDFDDCDLHDGAGGGPDGDCDDAAFDGDPDETVLCDNAVDDDADGYVNDGCDAVDDPEVDECDDATDDDGDTYINDGCPEQSGDPEEGDECLNALDDEEPEYDLDPATYCPSDANCCDNNTDDDEDGYVNDGCPAVDEPETGDECLNDTDDETGDEAIGESGTDCVFGDNVDDDDDGYVNDGCPAAVLPEDPDTECDDLVDDDADGYINDGCPARGDGVVNDGCPTVGDGYVNDGCPTIGDGLIDEDPRNPVGIAYDPDSHKFTCEHMLYDPDMMIRGAVVVGDAELQTEVLINKAPFLVWYLKMYQVKLENIPLKDDEGRADHNAGKWTGEDPTGEGSDAETLNVSQDALLRATVKGYFHGANNSSRGAVCVDMDGDGSGATDDDDDGDGTADEDPLDGEDNDGDTLIDEDPAPGEPYLIGAGQWETGCPDAGDEPVETGHWVLPDDFVIMASAEDLGNITGGMLASLDVMSDIGDSPKATGVVGPKSTLDSHDAVPRPWIPCLMDACTRKTVDPDTEITVADAIMPALKIRAQIAGVTSAEHANDAGFLKGADKDDDVGITSLYQKIMIPADPEIPPFIVGGSYDWDSWLCRIEDGNIPSPLDIDSDGVPAPPDNCPTVPNPNQYDLDGDGIGDECDDDADDDQTGAEGESSPGAGDGDRCDDGIDNDGDTKTDAADDDCKDVCPFDDTLTHCDATGCDGTDTDKDYRPDACDIDPDDKDAKDVDSDQDGVKDTSDNCPYHETAGVVDSQNTNQNDFDKDGDGDVCDLNPFVKFVAPIYYCPNAYLGAQMGPYEFYDVLQTLPVTDCPDLAGELCNADIGNQLDQSPDDTAHPRIIEFYTDNRGMGFFFANGDYNLSFDDCGTGQLYGAPDCSPGDVVGESNIKVIGQYPYTRAPEKLRNVISNPVVKTWEWGGFKSVTKEVLDVSHTRIIAHLKDRDGYCKYEVDAKKDPMKVQFSPSLNPVEGEEITFEIVNGIGHILSADLDGISPNVKEFSVDPSPLVETTVSGWEDGVWINAEKAIARAEHEALLAAKDQGALVVEADECQAWIVIEHAMGAELEVSVVFDDPEGRITRHWPPTELTVNLAKGWNDSCYVDEGATPEDAMADVFADVLAIYRFTADQTWERYIPGRCDEEGLCTIETLEPYDQLFILMADSGTWIQPHITAGAAANNKDKRVDLAGASADDEVSAAWNSVCYAGVDKLTEEATRDIETAFVIMYNLGSDQMWRRYVPGRPDIPDTLTTLHMFDSVFLLVTAEGGITWKFDP